MTTITENTTIKKKAPAKKTPAKKGVTIEQERLENIKAYNNLTEEEKKAKYGVNLPSLDEKAKEEEKRLLDVIEPTEATRVTKVDELEESLKSYKMRLDSMHEKNEALQGKLDVINTDSVQIVIPQRYLQKLITESISKSGDELSERVFEADEMLSRLHADDVQEVLKDLLELKDLKEKVKDLEYAVDDLPDRYYVEDEVSNMTSEFVDEYEIERIVERKTEGLVDYDDFVIDLNVLRDRLSILENKNNNKGLLSKLSSLIKRLFSYNFKSKVEV